MTSECVPFSETLWERFDRIDNMVNPSSETRVVNLVQTYGASTATEVYGICMQARYGDQTATYEE